MFLQKTKHLCFTQHSIQNDLSTKARIFKKYNWAQLIKLEKKYSSVFSFSTSFMLVIQLPILFSLPFDLQWKDDFLVDKRQLRKSVLRLKASVLWFLSCETKGLLNSHCTSHRPSSLGAHYRLCSLLWHWQKNIKRPNSGFKTWGLNHPLSPEKANTSVMCSKSDFVVRNQKSPSLKLCWGVSAFGRNSWPAQLHSSLLVDLWNNGIEKWLKLTTKHCSSQTQPHFEELLLLN